MNPGIPIKIYDTQFGHAPQMRVCFMKMMLVTFEEFTLVKEDALPIWTNHINQPYDQFVSSLIPVMGDILLGRPNAQNDEMWKKYVKTMEMGFCEVVCKNDMYHPITPELEWLHRRGWCLNV